MVLWHYVIKGTGFYSVAANLRAVAQLIDLHELSDAAFILVRMQLSTKLLLDPADFFWQACVPEAQPLPWKLSQCEFKETGCQLMEDCHAD